MTAIAISVLDAASHCLPHFGFASASWTIKQGQSHSALTTQIGIQ